MRVTLILFIVGIGLVAGLRSRYYALLLYIWFAEFRPQEWVWGVIEEFRLSAVAGLVLVVPALATGQWPNFTHPLCIGMGTFLGLCFLSQWGSFDPQAGWVALNYLLPLVLVSMLMVTLITTPRRFTGAMGVMAGSLGIHGAHSGIAVLFRGGRLMTGIGGTLNDNNAFALGIVRIIYPMIAAGQNTPWPLVRLAFYAATPLCIGAVIGTLSRGGFLALIASAVVFILLQRSRSYWFVGTIIFGLMAALLLPQDYLTRVQTITTYEEVRDNSALDRVYFWHVAFLMAKARPFGVGLGNFEVAFDRFDPSMGEHGVQRAAHSYHFQVLGETAFGLFVFESIVAYALICALRIRRWSLVSDLPPEMSRFFFTSSTALVATLVAFVVGGSFLSQALNDLNWLTFGLVASLDRLSYESGRGEVRAKKPIAASAASPATSGT